MAEYQFEDDDAVLTDVIFMENMTKLGHYLPATYKVNLFIILFYYGLPKQCFFSLSPTWV